MSSTRAMNPPTAGGSPLKFFVGIGDSVKSILRIAYKEEAKYPLDTYPLPKP